MHARVEPAEHDGEHVEHKNPGADVVRRLRDSHARQHVLDDVCRILNERLRGRERRRIGGRGRDV